MLATLLTAFSVGAAPVPETTLAIPYEKYVIEANGLEVILHEDHSLPIVAVNIWYHTGPLNEPPGLSGFAHLFEHLMFQSSKHVAEDQYFKLLEAAGASQVNGTTDYDRTNYFETVPSNQLALALWLESDRMGFLLDSLTQASFENQRNVVMNERRQSVENAPYGPSDEALVHALFPPDHPYYGFVIGSMDDLMAATVEDARAFYWKYYSPANATLVIAGDFAPQQARALVEAYFGTLVRRPEPEPREVVTPSITEERALSVTEPVTLPRIQMAWLSPPAYAPGDAESDILALVLGGGKSSRLYQRLVYELELAQNVSAAQESLALTSIFTVTVMGRPGVDLAQLQAETEKVIDELKAAPPRDEEVTRARNQILTHVVSNLQRLGGFGGRADALNRYNQYVGDPGYLSRDLARYETITPRQVQDLARSLLAYDERVVVTTLPER